MARKSTKAKGKAKGKKKSRSVTVDMSDVESFGLVPEGEWLTEIIECDLETSDNSGKDYLSFKGKTEKGNVFWNCSLQAKALFNLRGLLEACELEIPEGPFDIDFDDLVGCEFVATIEHEKYEGKDRTRVTDYAKASEYEEVEAGDEDEDDEDEDEEEVDEETEDEDEEEDEDEVEVDGEEDDDDLPLVSEEELGDMDAKDFPALIKKYGLDVNLKKHRSARKKISVLVDALEEAGYLDEE
jgi:hypothetical protein